MNEMFNNYCYDNDDVDDNNDDNTDNNDNEDNDNDDLMMIIGSVSITDGDGSENITTEMNSRFFHFSKLLKMSNVGECPRVAFLGTVYSSFFVVACLRPPVKRENRHLHVVVGQ